MTFNRANTTTLLGSTSGSTQVHTNRQTKLGEVGWEGLGGGHDGVGGRRGCRKQGEVLRKWGVGLGGCVIR